MPDHSITSSAEANSVCLASESRDLDKATRWDVKVGRNPTPTKVRTGHDENITVAQMCRFSAPRSPLLLLVATDRVSAFDVVMGQAVPRKGVVLTQISAWWFRRLEAVTAHHMLTADTDEIIAE